MKVNKIIYWVTTAIVAVMMLFAAFSYFTSPDVKASFAHLGFPDYFRVELGVAKLLGAIVLILPFVPRKLKEFAYAGFAIVFVSAFIAHLSVGDPISAAIMPVIVLIFLAVSYLYFLKLNKTSV
jgi:hypothetical protein